MNYRNPSKVAEAIAHITDAAPVEAEVVTMSDVEPEHVDWLWANRIPLGKLTVLDGDPGVGKSTVALDLAARVSCEASMPDGAAGLLGDVLLLSAEDGLGDTIRPRLDAAGADCTRVHAVRRREISLPDDVPWLVTQVAEYRARLLILDPLVEFLSPKVNSFRDQDVRRALGPLADLAAQTGAAVLVIRHLAKSAGRSALYRGGGSIGIAAAARAVHLVAEDPVDPELRVLAPVKFNLGQMPAALQFRLENVEGVEGAQSVARIHWLGTSRLTADQLLNPLPNLGGGEHESPVDIWLRGYLADGPRPLAEVLQAAQRQGYPERTVHYARKRLRVVTTVHGFGSEKESVWSLPISAIAARTANTAMPTRLEEGGSYGAGGAQEKEPAITATASGNKDHGRDGSYCGDGSYEGDSPPAWDGPPPEEPPSDIDDLLVDDALADSEGLAPHRPRQSGNEDG